MEFECPNGWQLVSLHELGEVGRGRSRYRPRYAEHLYGGPYPFIQTGDVKASNGKITSYSQTYSEVGLAQSRLWPSGTMCITIAANIAETAILTFPACFPDSVVGFIADPLKADVKFIEYMFRFMRKRIQHQATGSVQDNINIQTLERLRFPIPPIQVQKAIAKILGDLDDKIELNRRMNETLESMARALFKSWFVDFDPVRAKLDGRQPTGMDATTAALFPDSFQDSSLGHIPKGWQACTLGDIANNVSITFDFKRTLEVVFINTGDVLEGDFLHEKRSQHTGLPGQAKKSIRPDDILFSEIRPANKRYAYVDFDSSDYVVSTKFMVIRGSEAIHPRLMYRILTAQETLDEFQLQAESRSGTFPQITFDSVNSMPIILPPIEIQEAFQRAVGKLDAQTKINKQQSRTLATLRETILPKLLSGEMRVTPESSLPCY